MSRASRRGVILPVVLIIIGMLALTMTGFLFFVRAETAGIQAYSDGQQARLATDSGLEEVVAQLRLDKHGVRSWYDAPDRWRHALVFADGYDRQSDPVRQTGSRAEYLSRGSSPSPAWRFSVVASRLDGPEDTIRFGVTPESARLNLNTATDGQITELLTPLLFELNVQNAPELIAAVLDWRDGDDQTRDGGAENEYYNTLDPPYRSKDAPFDTVEELLIVRGFSAAILYGEDTNRNGVLDPNENDGDATIPLYDNQDGILNFGVAPFLTISSREPDTALDNKPRINLTADAAIITLQMQKDLTEGELSEATIAFLTQLKSQNADFSQLASPADLYPVGEATDDSSGETPDGAAGGEGTAISGAEFQFEPENEEADAEKDEFRSQDADPQAEGDEQESGDEQAGEQPAPAPTRNPRSGGAGSRGGRRGGGETPDIRELIRNSPVTLAEMPVLMDRFTTRPAAQAAPGAPPGAAGLIPGLININAAPARILALIPGITPEAAAAIASTRATLDPATLSTTAWPLTTGAIEPGVFKAIAPYITTKSYQFHVEVVGYADHVRLSRRHEWIIEMIGPIAQIRYDRDLSSLGLAWPIDSETQIVSQ